MNGLAGRIALGLSPIPIICMGLLVTQCDFGNFTDEYFGSPDDLVGDLKSGGIVFVKTTRENTLNSTGNGNLFSLTPASPSGTLKNLTNLESGDVADPEISYDGTKILFAMRDNAKTKTWCIHEMNLDGSNLRRLTDDGGNDFDPTYLPSGKIVFTSDRPGTVDEYNVSPTQVLHRMNADGSNLEQISFNLSDDFDPIVLRNGLVGYTRWEHHGTMNRFPLFRTNPDGASTFLLFGPHTEGVNRNFFHPREMPDGSLVAVMSQRVNGDAGALAILILNDHHADPPEDGDFQNITPDIVSDNQLNLEEGEMPKGAFKYPHPLPDGRLMVSYSPKADEDGDMDYGLYTIGTDGKGLAMFYNDTRTHEYDCVVIAPRPMPQEVPEVVDGTSTTGEFLDLSVYFRQTNDGQEVPVPGTESEIKEVMVIEGLPRRRGSTDDISINSFEQKRILGTAPVHADGSTRFRVPTDVPLSVNSLDRLGRSVVTKRTWFWIRPGEPQAKCVGCHSPRGLKPPSEDVIAKFLPAADLDIPEASRYTANFRDDVTPIIAAKCEGCHSGSAPAADLNLSTQTDPADPRFSYAYTSLMGDRRGSPQLVREPFSRDSYLADRLLGREARPELGFGPHPSGDTTLTSDEIRKILNWIDLGATWK